MKYLELRSAVRTNIFSVTDIITLFNDESLPLMRMQLSRFRKRKLVTQIKRELYCFDPEQVDEYELAPLLYHPSYISMESALNYYGIIPDVPQSVTSISPTTTKKIKTAFGSYGYSKIDIKLFYGFTSIQSAKSKRFYYLAEKEKAVLDYLYIRKITTVADLRLDIKKLSRTRYQFLAQPYPDWIKKLLP